MQISFYFFLAKKYYIRNLTVLKFWPKFHFFLAKREEYYIRNLTMLKIWLEYLHYDFHEEFL